MAHKTFYRGRLTGMSLDQGQADVQKRLNFICVQTKSAKMLYLTRLHFVRKHGTVRICTKLYYNETILEVRYYLNSKISRLILQEEIFISQCDVVCL